MDGVAASLGLGPSTPVPWGRQVALCARGARSAARCNACGWALHHQQALAIPMGPALATAAMAGWTGLRAAEHPDDQPVVVRYVAPC
jgi:hypothetical protein